MAPENVVGLLIMRVSMSDAIVEEGDVVVVVCARNLSISFLRSAFSFSLASAELVRSVTRKSIADNASLNSCSIIAA